MSTQKYSVKPWHYITDISIVLTHHTKTEALRCRDCRTQLNTKKHPIKLSKHEMPAFQDIAIKGETLIKFNNMKKIF